MMMFSPLLVLPVIVLLLYCPTTAAFQRTFFLHSSSSRRIRPPPGRPAEAVGSSWSSGSTSCSFLTIIGTAVTRDNGEYGDQEASGITSTAACSSSRTSRQTRRRQFLSTTAAASVLGGLGGSLGSFGEARAAADSGKSIAPCKKNSGAPTNCVSTASVKQVDLYMPPWVWSQEGTTTEEVMARLKGAIAADSSLTLQEQQDNNNYLRVTATRNFCVDEIEFVINPADRVVTFRSQQIEGPDNVSDFGANRKRLEELRKQTKVLTVMGEEFASADAGPREGAVGQLKAFWGLQSGGGYEAILLDDDSDGY